MGIEPGRVRRMPLRDRNRLYLHYRANEEARLSIAKREQVTLAQVPKFLF